MTRKKNVGRKSIPTWRLINNIKHALNDPESPYQKRRRLNDENAVIAANQREHNNATSMPKKRKRRSRRRSHEEIEESSTNQPDHNINHLHSANSNTTSIKSEHSEKGLAALQQTVKDLEHQLEAQKRESKKRISDLLLRMKALKEMAINGSEPLYHCVPMHGHNGTKNRKYSEKCYNLRDQIMQKYGNQDGRMAVEVNDNPYYPRSARELSMLKRLVLEYLRENELDVSVTELSIGGVRMECDSVLEEFVIAKPHHIPALIGQKGLRAKRDIPRNTIIGQYTGVTYLKEEYQLIFESSSEGYLRNMYAFDLVVDVIDEDHEEKEVALVLDGYALTQMIGESGHLMRINDCRLDIENAQPSDNDRKFENVEMLECKVNGWPIVLAVTRKNIKAGEELFAFFGAEFGSAMRGWDENMKFRHRVRMCLDSQVMKEERDALVNDHHDTCNAD